MKARKCKQCGSEKVTEEQARRTYEEYDTVLCFGCEAGWLEKIAQGKTTEAQDEAPTPPGYSPEAWQALHPDILFYLYEDGPGGPTYAAPDPGPLPAGARFTGFIRPKRGGVSYQLFQLPYKLLHEVPALPAQAPAGISQEAQAALRLGGFIFPDQQ